MTNPFSFDAENFMPDADYKSKIVINDLIREYLDVGHHDSKLLLVAPKGVGKSLLLRTKSYLYREKLKGPVKLAETDQLTEKLLFYYNTFSKDDLLKFNDRTTWTNIWRFTLLIVVIRTYGLKLDPKIEKIFGDPQEVSSVLTILMANRGKVTHYFNTLMPILIKQLFQIKSAVALFLDNVEQQFEDILREKDHYTDLYEEGKIASVSIWVYAQIGLVAAIYEINRANSHVKIFATIRSEAFARVGQLKPNYLNYSTILKYTREETNQIFSRKIESMKKELYVKPDGENFIEKFLGFRQMPHPYAKDDKGQSRVEDAFDFLYRHSYGRPREIIRFGHELYNHHTKSTNKEYMDKTIEDKIEHVRGVVNDFSSIYFSEYKNEIIPEFDDNKLDLFVRSVQSNVIIKSDISKLDGHFVKWLYNLGLLGYTVKKNNTPNILKQKFLSVANYNYTNLEDIHNSDYYVLHPSMDHTFDKIHGNVYNRYNIIGDENDFYIPQNPDDVKPPKDATYKDSLNPLNTYFIPKISGKRWDQNGIKHNKPLSQIYQHYFNEFPSKEKDNIELANKILHVIGKLKIHSIIKTEMDISELEKIFNTHRICRYYKKDIDINKNDFKETFRDRIFGRIIVAASYSILKLSVKTIHYLLQNEKFKIDFNNISGDNEFRYIQHCFFLKGLIDDTKKTIRESELENSRIILFSCLSDYEKNVIKNWHIEFKNFIETRFDETQKAIINKELNTPY